MSDHMKRAALEPTDGINALSRRALICCLCHKFYAAHEAEVFIKSRPPTSPDIAAEMLSDLTGLTVRKLYDVFEDCEGTGDAIFLELESLLPPCHAPGEDRQLREMVRKSLLGFLCQNLQRLLDRHIIRLLDLRRADSVDLVAELVGNLVGLQAEEVYEIFDRCKGMGDKLALELEPRLAAGHGEWMIP